MADFKNLTPLELCLELHKAQTAYLMARSDRARELELELDRKMKVLKEMKNVIDVFGQQIEQFK